MGSTAPTEAKIADPGPAQEAATPDVAPGGPVKATPPRSDGIEGAPVPSGDVASPVPEERFQPVKAGRAKAAPAKTARKATRPAPAKARPATGQPGTNVTEPVAPPPGATTAAGSTSIGAVRATTGQVTGKEGEDRTGAEPIPPADPQPPTDTPPTEEKRTGADPIPPAEDGVKETGIVAPKPPVPAPAEAAATAKAVAARSEPWAQLVADPGHAPELLALAAVQTIGPRAGEWAARHREAYPKATADALARLAVQQFTRFGSVSSVFAAVAGSYAPITLLGSNALTYAEIVLHVAAAYGQDPTDRERAVDLLVLAQVHPSREDAEAALATAEQPAYEDETRLTDAVWRLGRMVAAQAAAWAVLKGVNRFFPGTSMLAAIMTSRSGARNMGAKATAYYRARS